MANIPGYMNAALITYGCLRNESQLGNGIKQSWKQSGAKYPHRGNYPETFYGAKVIREWIMIQRLRYTPGKMKQDVES